MNNIRLLVGSPVYQKTQILEAFLDSLGSLKSDTFSLDFMFIDDNIDTKSSQLLIDFKRKNSQVMIIPGKEVGIYNCNEESHSWNDDLMLKVANYKNTIIDYAIKQEYDFLFFIDSDLVIHPNLIEHLKKRDKDIVSEIFWSKWHQDSSYEPNVWMFDEYDLVPKIPGEVLDKKEMHIRKIKFLNQLRIPGLYEVGGLGACTLISKKALASGVNFSPIKNLTIHGEDRFFCIRAAVLNLDLHVDTVYPAYHIYRESDMVGVSDYVKECKAEMNFVRQFEQGASRITLSMVVKNEEKRYIKQVIESVRDIIDEAVIIDDGCNDGTIRLCKELLKDIPIHIVRNKTSLFASEYELRKKQWDETIKTNPDWILNIDADEVLEHKMRNEVKDLVNNRAFDVLNFRLYDMWDETHYREENYWNAHQFYRPFLIRYQPTFRYIWKQTSQHCGRFPINLDALPGTNALCRVQHYGWSRPFERIEKYKRYQALDPDAIYGIKEQYNSILDANPNLIKWEEDEACEKK